MFTLRNPLFRSSLPFACLALLMFTSCDDDKVPTPPAPKPVLTGENLIVCNEGNWQSDNGQLSYFDSRTGTLTNQWFRAVNGIKLGDTPNDIIQINDTLIAIAVNWSNIIQYIHPDGTACGATENVPNNRRMCSDGEYLYVTSYAHRCGDETFEKGYVAKIDVRTKQVVATCEVGWEPEAVKLYDGRLYVCNSGGYAYSENHDYETTIDVVDASTMTSLRKIETGCINLYGEASQAGEYLCINSCGNYYDVDPKTIILNCKTETMTTYEFPCTYNTTDGKLFYTLGSHFSYITGEYIYHTHTIDPTENSVGDSICSVAITEQIKSLTSPNEIYISPFSGNIYFTDAGSYASAGYLYGYKPDGTPIFEPQKVYICPAHILAIPLYEMLPTSTL